MQRTWVCAWVVWDAPLASVLAEASFCDFRHTWTTSQAVITLWKSCILVDTHWLCTSSLSWWDLPPTSSLCDHPRAFGSGSHFVIWLRNCVFPLGKWAKIPFLSKLIPIIALTIPKLPDFDQGPCPKGLRTKQIIWDWQCLQRKYLPNGSISIEGSSLGLARFFSPFRGWSQCSPLDSAAVWTAGGFQPQVSPKPSLFVPSAFPLPLIGSMHTAHRRLDWI